MRPNLDGRLNHRVCVRRLFSWHFSSWRFIAVAPVALFSFLGFAQQASAAILQTGDIIVSDFTTGKVFKVDPVSGAQTTIASVGIPGGIAIENSGSILVADRSNQSILRINPVTGTQTVVSSGGSFVNIDDVEVEANGQILVTDAGTGAIFRVDPITGAQSTVSSGSLFTNLLRGAAVKSNGDILVLNNNVIQVDPGTGSQTLLSSGSEYQASANIAFEANGDILVADRGSGVIRVDPLSGATTSVASGGVFIDIFGIAVESTGQIIVSNFVTDSIYRVDPISGTAVLLSSGGFLADPLDIEIYSIPEPSAFTLVAFGLLSLGFVRSRRLVNEAETSSVTIQMH